jgi:transposase InsO family protein
LLPLDDFLYALQPSLPHPSRLALHRCLQQRAISRLHEVGGGKPAKKRFKRYPIGYFHIDLAEVRTAEGKLNPFFAIDRTSKFAFVRLEKRAGKMEAAQFLRDLLQALPYRVHTVLTDNGIQFTNRALDAHAFAHIFDRVCSENEVEHRLTKVRHTWTNGQFERMNRTIKEATVKRFHYDDHSQRRNISRTSLTRITTPVD